MCDARRTEVTAPPPVPAATDRFGELLGRLVRLTRHDVDEILAEQAVTRQRFGQVALRWRLCEPGHVWQAWADQLDGRAPRIDLSAVGVDARAAAELPAWLAGSLGVVPVRSTAGRLVVATTAAALPAAAAALAGRAGKPVAFVVADRDQIRAAVRRYYGVEVAAAAMARPPCAGARCGTKCLGTACPALAKRRAAESVAARAAIATVQKSS